MKGIRVPLKKAEEAKRTVLFLDAYDSGFQMYVEDDHIHIPVIEEKLSEVLEKVEAGVEIDVDFKETPKDGNFKDEVMNILNVEEAEHFRHAYDVIGEIAILEIDEVLEPKEKEIADILLKTSRRIKTVLKKAGEHSGEFRTQEMAFLAGENNRETIHMENGCRLLIDVGHVYYSPRSATERKRVASLVKKDEDVLVMFSGAGPFVCVIGKNTNARSVVGVEKNPVGHSYAVKNVEMNKIQNAELHEGDVREIVPALGRKFDRIMMPLPKSADLFLDVAINALNKGGVIHYYDFLNEKDFDEAREKVDKACKEAGVSWRELSFTKCGQFSPYTFRVCLDFVTTSE